LPLRNQQNKYTINQFISQSYWKAKPNEAVQNAMYYFYFGNTMINCQFNLLKTNPEPQTAIRSFYNKPSLKTNPNYMLTDYISL
jgi:hypothetical protein